jgi:transposase
MGRCYSMEVSERVTAFVAQRYSRRAAARRLSVSESSVKNVAQAR